MIWGDRRLRTIYGNMEEPKTITGKTAESSRRLRSMELRTVSEMVLGTNTASQDFLLLSRWFMQVLSLVLANNGLRLLVCCSRATSNLRAATTTAPSKPREAVAAATRPSCTMAATWSLLPITAAAAPSTATIATAPATPCSI